ncbi:MAG: tRNA epoxyqueuosine(34) reductase QueG [Acidimicrobiales bacterium]
MPPPAVAATVPTEALRAVGRRAGLDAVGFARAEPFDGTRRHLEARRDAGLHAGMAFTYKNPERSTSPQLLLRNARSLVVGARSYLRTAPAAPTDQPYGEVARYAWEDHYAGLKAGLEAIAAELRAHGHRAAVFADGNHLVDREAAHRAGLGWYGKNTNLLVGERGSWFVLGAVVTDAHLPADQPPADGCGTCRRCLDGCPTGALPAPGVLDANRCLAWLAQRPGHFPVELREALGTRIYGCDDCQTVCPPNRREEHRHHAQPPHERAGHEQRVELRARRAPAEAVHVPLLDLLAADDDEILRRWGRWYLPDRRTTALRRNALIALGNAADPADARVVGRLARSLADAEPVLRATAIWAVRRLGLDGELAVELAARRTDADPAVRAELDTPVTVRPRTIRRDSPVTPGRP